MIPVPSNLYQKKVHFGLPGVARCHGTTLCFALFLAIWGLSSHTVFADPQYSGPLLYGLDPVIRATDDPRLLGVERLLLLRRLENLGIDRRTTGFTRPTVKSSLRKYWYDKSRVDLERQDHLLEYDGPKGLLFKFQYPQFIFFFPTPETLPGGITYYPPRPVNSPEVKVFVDELESGIRRRQTVDRKQSRLEMLAVAGNGRTGNKGGGLINLTIPIKLPRTLEKIIGRGEKTKIKISGREHISLGGESTVVKPFTANERVTSQSLFPSLDMTQELQVNLSGTIGEKIIIEVDHNSAAIGPDATKIKLMYRGLEDEIIKTIETGDVGLTLPGSQLLGYSSNKSGLFGLKVTGQVGRADFTFVTSKQKSESSSKTFNAKGGQVEDRIIYSSDYLNNRFFRLDFPKAYTAPNDPNYEPLGREPGQSIDLSSLKIYKMMGPGQSTTGFIENVAAYVDSLGMNAWPGSMDFSNPHIYGQRWREIIAFDPLLDADGSLVAVDMRTRMLDDDVLAVTYDVVDANGTVVKTVGDRPGIDDPSQTLDGSEEVFYRLKLLKAPINDNHKHLFAYVMRNIYSLGGSNIDPTTFELRIERNTTGESQPQLDENGLDYFRIFGLDKENAQGLPGSDGVVDSNNPYIFDLKKGLLKFPLDFPTPFAADSTQYEAYANDPGFVWGPGSFLTENQAPQLYDPTVFPTDYSKYQYFRIVARHASASSSFNLGASNIEEGSESVVVDGRTLTRGTDYEIDYNYGEINLMGDAANLTPDSQIAINYQYAPFIGGGKTSLTGFNLGYDFGRDSKLSTTWLYQSEAIVGNKAKLGAEPSHSLVGNINLNSTFRPYFLTHVANFLSRHDSERESSVQFSGEFALSLPNPNTEGQVYLEDFEGVDSSNYISLNRTGWSWSSAPMERKILRNGKLSNFSFDPEDRVTTRWFLPKERVLRRYLNPGLINQERDDTQQVMDLYLRSENGEWGEDSWGGIMRGISRTGIDLSKTQFVEIWVNDGEPDRDLRQGRLHIDFGYINEDGFWPLGSDGKLVIGTYEQEDGVGAGIRDGVWTYDEDIGLDGNENGPQRYRADYEVDGDQPFPYINGTARNNREDSEDLNRNTRLDRDEGCFSVAIDLKDTEPLIDVDYDFDEVQDLVDAGIAWRKYRIPIGAADSVSINTVPNIKAITHARIWYEKGDDRQGKTEHLQLSEFKFLGSRWEREGVRRISDEVVLDDVARRGAAFFLGEANNKENPDYHSPFSVREINNIPEKEQSLVLDFQNLQQGQMIRTGKQVSPRGDDYTIYRDLSWYFYNPSQRTADLDLFFRAGSDSLNFYEVSYRYANSVSKTGWRQLTVNLAELSNIKNGEMDQDGVIHGEIQDSKTGDTYPVRVVGRPDLRQIKRYYFGIMNQALSEGVDGYFYFNDVRLEDVKKDSGMAQRAGVRVNMADVFKLDFDWKHTDADFHGLDKRVGSGVDFKDWNVASNFKVDDFVPLLGFRLPVNFSRRQTVHSPKYVTNSDIEIIDEEMRTAMSTVNKQERFSSRISHSPSKNVLARYFVDPWTMVVNGSRSRTDGPLDLKWQKNLQGSLNYDLRISSRYTLGNYPVLGAIPILRGLSLIPKKIALGANFTSSWSSNATIDEDGNVSPRPRVVTRPGALNASFDYKPANILDLTVTAKSDRDLLRESRTWGVNIGEENKRSYNLRMTVSAPRAKEMPSGKFFSPLRTMVRGLNKLRPSIQYTGGFADQHGPGIRQAGDDNSVRSVNNNGNWDFRFDLPAGDFFKRVIPEHKVSRSDRARLIDEQRRREQRAQHSGDRTGSSPNTGSSNTGEDLTDLTPEERRRRDEERLLQEAQDRLEEERAQGLVSKETTPALNSEGRINPLVVFGPVLNVFRNMTPVKMTVSNKKNSSYSRLQQTAPFWYQAGFANTLDVADSLYAAMSFQDRNDLNISTSTKVNKNISMDFKYGKNSSSRDQVGSRTQSLKKNWPDVSLSISGIEKWGVFGFKDGDQNSGWFRSSNVNFSYKRSLTVNNYTATVYNPTTSTTMSPRWTFNFHSGLTANINSTITKSDALSNGVLTTTNKLRIGLQLKHQFRAQSLLAKLKLYKPGNNPTVNMDVDISYQRDKTDRLNPGSKVSAPTGQVRYSVNPRFSYQISRSLNGAVRFNFSKSKDVATDRTTTSFGLGVEATFVF